MPPSSAVAIEGDAAGDLPNAHWTDVNLYIHTQTRTLRLRTFKSISDPKGYGAMVDATRRRMIFLLRAKDMTVSQLAEALRRTPQAIYHQIGILQKVGMVEVAREERVGHLIETYYRATAEVFLFQDGEVNRAQSREMWSEALSALSRVGMPVRTDAEFVKMVARANAAMAKFRLPADLEEKLSRLDEPILLTNARARDLAQLALMSDRQFDGFMAAWRELRALMASGVARKKASG